MYYTSSKGHGIPHKGSGIEAAPHSIVIGVSDAGAETRETEENNEYLPQSYRDFVAGESAVIDELSGDVELSND